jgi:phosphoribosylformylglycinamidine cyclo-ligase
MGHRFEIYTDQESAAEIISIAAKFNLDARIIGHCEKADARKLTIRSEYGTFEY